MLDSLITSKTRVKLLMKFFLNPGMSAHLRGLQEEFDESSNGIRLELNRLEEAGMLVSHQDGQKKVFQVATQHPLFADINSILRKYLGLDQLVDQVVQGLGGLEKVYLVGDLACGRDSREIKIFFLGDIRDEFLMKVLSKTESLIGRKVVAQVYKNQNELHNLLKIQPHLLLWSAE